jgi:hypothetical protein
MSPELQKTANDKTYDKNIRYAEECKGKPDVAYEQKEYCNNMARLGWQVSPMYQSSSGFG